MYSTVQFADLDITLKGLDTEWILSFVKGKLPLRKCILVKHPNLSSNEGEPVLCQRLSKNVSPLIISRNKRYGHITFFNMISNEMMPYINMFGP